METNFIKLGPQHLSGSNKNNTEIVSTHHIVRVEKSCDEKGKVLFYQIVLQEGDITNKIALSKVGYDLLKRVLTKKVAE